MFLSLMKSNLSVFSFVSASPALFKEPPCLPKVMKVYSPMSSLTALLFLLFTFISVARPKLFFVWCEVEIKISCLKRFV